MPKSTRSREYAASPSQPLAVRAQLFADATRAAREIILRSPGLIPGLTPNVNRETIRTVVEAEAVSENKTPDRSEPQSGTSVRLVQRSGTGQTKRRGPPRSVFKPPEGAETIVMTQEEYQAAKEAAKERSAIARTKRKKASLTPEEAFRQVTRSSSSDAPREVLRQPSSSLSSSAGGTSVSSSSSSSSNTPLQNVLSRTPKMKAGRVSPETLEQIMARRTRAPGSSSSSSSSNQTPDNNLDLAPDPAQPTTSAVDIPRIRPSAPPEEEDQKYGGNEQAVDVVDNQRGEVDPELGNVFRGVGRRLGDPGDDDPGDDGGGGGGGGGGGDDDPGDGGGGGAAAGAAAALIGARDLLNAFNAARGDDEGDEGDEGDKGDGDEGDGGGGDGGENDAVDVSMDGSESGYGDRRELELHQVNKPYLNLPRDINTFAANNAFRQQIARPDMYGNSGIGTMSEKFYDTYGRYNFPYSFSERVGTKAAKRLRRNMLGRPMLAPSAYMSGGLSELPYGLQPPVYEGGNSRNQVALMHKDYKSFMQYAAIQF